MLGKEFQQELLAHLRGDFDACLKILYRYKNLGMTQLEMHENMRKMCDELLLENDKRLDDNMLALRNIVWGICSPSEAIFESCLDISLEGKVVVVDPKIETDNNCLPRIQIESANLNNIGDENVNIRLSKDEALVLSDILDQILEDKDILSEIVDRKVVQIVNIQLEALLDDVFHPNYIEIVGEARKRLM